MHLLRFHYLLCRNEKNAEMKKPTTTRTSILSNWRNVSRWMEIFPLLVAINFVVLLSMILLINELTLPLKLKVFLLVLPLFMIMFAAFYLMSILVKMRTNICRVVRQPSLEDIGDLIEMKYERSKGTNFFYGYEHKIDTTIVELLTLDKEKICCTLNDAQKQKINYLLKSRHTPTVLATLNILEIIGDKNAYKCVCKLADGAWTASSNDEVKASANHSKSMIINRINSETAHATLLRPGQSPMDNLLRPAAGMRHDSADKKVLLRSSQNDDGNS